MIIVRGVKHPPSRIVIFGPAGVGKSTFACAAPGALALDYESGLEQIGVDRVRGAPSWDGTLSLAREACSGPGDHTTVVIDTVDRLEDQASAQVCHDGKKKSLSDFGYGDGYEALLTKWRELLYVLETAREKNREVILVAHVQQKIQDDPTLGKYDKFIAALSKRCWGATHRWADAVLFANYEAGLVEGRAIMTGERVLYSSAGTGYDAKNRWGLPRALPLSWASFDGARRSLQRTPEEVTASIRMLATAETKEKAEEFILGAGSDVPRLVSIETALKKKVTA